MILSKNAERVYKITNRNDKRVGNDLFFLRIFVQMFSAAKLKIAEMM